MGDAGDEPRTARRRLARKPTCLWEYEYWLVWHQSTETWGVGGEQDTKKLEEGGVLLLEVGALAGVLLHGLLQSRVDHGQQLDAEDARLDCRDIVHAQHSLDEARSSLHLQALITSPGKQTRALGKWQRLTVSGLASLLVLEELLAELVQGGVGCDVHL